MRILKVPGPRPKGPASLAIPAAARHINVRAWAEANGFCQRCQRDSEAGDAAAARDARRSVAVRNGAMWTRRAGRASSNGAVMVEMCLRWRRAKGSMASVIAAAMADAPLETLAIVPAPMA